MAPNPLTFTTSQHYSSLLSPILSKTNKHTNGKVSGGIKAHANIVSEVF